MRHQLKSLLIIFLFAISLTLLTMGVVHTAQLTQPFGVAGATNQLLKP